MSYERYYSENNFWNKIKLNFNKMGKKAICQIFALYYLMKSDKVSIINKTLIIGALGYLIFPIDLIPDITPGIGYTDDLAAIASLLIKLINFIDEKVINDVYFSVNKFFNISYNDVKRYIEC